MWGTSGFKHFYQIWTCLASVLLLFAFPAWLCGALSVDGAPG